MSNNLNLEKLVLKGLVLEGYFKRSCKTRQSEKQELKLKNSGLITPEMKAILDFKNQKFSFEVDILYFDSKTGIFIARGDDVFGESAISGKIGEEIYYRGIKQRGIEFKQIYIGEPRHGLDVQRPDLLDYEGHVISSEGKISCKGTWEIPHANSQEWGRWALNSAKYKK